MQDHDPDTPGIQENKKKLCESENRYRCMTEMLSDLVSEVDAQGKFTYISSAHHKVLGYKQEELLGTSVFDRVHPDDLERSKADFEETINAGGSRLREYRFLNGDGNYSWLQVSAVCVYDSQGDFSGMVAASRDITRYKMAEEALRSSEEHLRSVFQNAEEIIHMIAWDSTFLNISPSWERYTGFRVSETVGKSFLDYVHPDDQAACLEVVRKVYETGRPHKIMEFRVRHASGKWIWFMNSGVSIKDKQGTPLYFMGVASDITERKQAEEELLKQIEFNRTAFESLPGLFYLSDINGRMLQWNKNMVKLTGYTDEEIASMSSIDFFGENEKNKVLAAIKKVFVTGHVQEEASIVAKDGTATPHMCTGSIIHYQGEPCLIGVAFDISERKHLEEQLMQSQKMEAVGQLAGGVAHDFNNLLQAILGYVELVLMDIKPEDKQYGRLTEVKLAGERAAMLTRHLLAFSRRQVLQLAALDINQTVDELMGMLHRLIGEHIELVFKPCESALSIKGDKSQIEQVITNLCVNARDSMPAGGRLLIETDTFMVDEDFIYMHELAKPGWHMCISVSDTGCGMDKQTQQQIFEPFFTTKEKHKGTGLGLSMVYGIIRQHQGIVQVYSEVGQGTCFKIYIPAERTEQKECSIRQESEEPVGGTETILLAEDESMIRNLACNILTDAGYHVLTAVDGQDALDIYQAHAGEIAMLFLDVLMPKMGGRAVYDSARAKNPAVKCLFCSGYSRDGLHTNYVLDEGLHLLQKPYSRVALLRLIRQVLDERD